MRYCDLQSERKISEIFHNLGPNDYCLCISECKNEICQIVFIDASNSEPYKYSTTWKDNLIPFPDDRERKYMIIDQPKVIKVDCGSIHISLKGKNFILQYDKELVYKVSQRILVTDPTNISFSRFGVIESIQSNMDYLIKNNFIPKYKVRLDDGKIDYLNSYQISKAD